MDEILKKAKQAAHGFKDPRLRANALIRTLGLTKILIAIPPVDNGGWNYIYDNDVYTSIVKLYHGVFDGKKRQRETEEAAEIIASMGAVTAKKPKGPNSSNDMCIEFVSYSETNNLVFGSEKELAAGLRRFMASTGYTPLDIKNAYKEIKTVCLDDDFLNFLST
jgi:hypothetical protein